MARSRARSSSYPARKPESKQKGRREAQNAFPRDEYAVSDADLPRAPVTKKKAKPLEALNHKQQTYINSIKNKKVTFGLGPAGAGKTYIAGALACDMLDSKQVERIIITRPAVDAGESLGHLPGELDEKYEPYIAAFRDVLNDRFGKSYVEYCLKSGAIEAIPLGFMRGLTFKNCVVVLDEAQNATSLQMKLFLTRIGENCTVIINGDESQVDIPNSGLVDAVDRIQHIPCVNIVRFDARDIVRSGFVQEVVEAFED